MQTLSRFKALDVDVRGGLALLVATLIALVLANSPAAQFYQTIANGTEPSLLFIVNDGLMTIFFLLVGLEIRREIVDGELNSFSKAALPAIAAFGGFIFPALIYICVTWTDGVALRGFGIPVATDIAFAVGVLSIFGKRVPLSLRAFLLALAIFDDIGAIVLIAIFYSHSISIWALLLAFAVVIVMITLRRFRVAILAPYIVLSVVLWGLTLWSGVHPTIAGVVAAFLIPAEVHSLQHRLHPWIAFCILPLFAFLNAGVSLLGLTLHDLTTPISLGIMLGLVFGKPFGVFLFTWLCVRLGFAPKPTMTTWPQIFGVAVVCGIGFTMSLFVGMLAFEQNGQTQQSFVRSGVLLGSIVSAIIGSIILNLTLRKTHAPIENL